MQHKLESSCILLHIFLFQGECLNTEGNNHSGGLGRLHQRVELAESQSGSDRLLTGTHLEYASGNLERKIGPPNMIDEASENQIVRQAYRFLTEDQWSGLGCGNVCSARFLNQSPSESSVISRSFFPYR